MTFVSPLKANHQHSLIKWILNFHNIKFGKRIIPTSRACKLKWKLRKIEKQPPSWICLCTFKDRRLIAIKLFSFSNPLKLFPRSNNDRKLLQLHFETHPACHKLPISRFLVKWQIFFHRQRSVVFYFGDTYEVSRVNRSQTKVSFKLKFKYDLLQNLAELSWIIKVLIDRKQIYQIYSNSSSFVFFPYATVYGFERMSFLVFIGVMLLIPSFNDTRKCNMCLDALRHRRNTHTVWSCLACLQVDQIKIQARVFECDIKTCRDLWSSKRFGRNMSNIFSAYQRSFNNIEVSNKTSQKARLSFFWSFEF